MKGLLIKDFMLMKNMKHSLLIIAIVAIGMSYYMNDLSFIIVYLAILGTTFTSSTLSYDEFDKGYAYLFTLPVTKKDYVMEKYGFGLVMSMGGWLFGTVLVTVSGFIRHTSTIADSIMLGLMLIPVPLLLLAVLLPFHIKFGGEKGRIIMIAITGAFFVICIIAAKLVNKLEVDISILWERLPAMGTGGMIVCGIGIGLAILILSCRISISIVNKWEF